ncbi:MAG: hypothetical protein M3063_16490 [Actinomycetota bacterium]|nr:hypothetical protein [Actinomycetota bacterium]
MAVGAVFFAAGYLWFAVGATNVVVLAPAFILAGLGIGCAETAQSAAVAAVAPTGLRGSAFGLLATAQAVANLAASAIAGLLWSTVSPAAGFVFLAGAMVVAIPLILTVRAGSPASH